MECPHCGNLSSKVIDSRLSGDRVSIRRRRQCPACWERYTTYESTQERMFPLLIRKKAGSRSKHANLKTMLPFISHTLKDLSRETQKLVAQVDKLQFAQAAFGAKRNHVAEKATRKRMLRKTKAVRKTAAETATDTVLKVLRRYRKGLGIAALKAETGFGDKKVRNIVHRAVKQRKIRRVDRGVYIIA